ncbi:S-adenosyl-L-methionine-dependent methyltransferase [Dentipellis sp. KUC8613]|nr:S-adenosyl-L-methionine-dependent methyltransferase [Dentipellis sp. KUC8613]
MSTSISPSTPTQLLTLIQTSLESLQRAGHTIPDLDDLSTPDTFRADPAAALAADTAAAAALHLAAMLMPPHVVLHHVTGGHYRSAAARVCLESHVTEILREAGPQGMHVDEIAAKNGQDPGKLARFLRYLAMNHVYREVSPDVFANTRISSLLDTRKPSAEVIADPEHKYDRTVSLAAHVGKNLDDTFKASAHIWEALSDPQHPARTPFSRAFGTDDTVWAFYARPGQKYRQRRFDSAMRGVEAMQPADAILDAYDWTALPPGAVVVDVGGGVGTSAFALARAYPALRLVVQDRQNVIEDAKKLWSATMPEAVDSGRVSLEAHDFFTPQPTRTPNAPASVFLLKQITHDWSDAHARTILRHLRAAAGRETRLVLVDTVMGYACRVPDVGGEQGKGEEGEEVPGARPVEAPAPLLANFGAVREVGAQIDIAMYILYNGQERTLPHLRRLLSEAGWALRAVRRNAADSAYLPGVEAVPIFESEDEGFEKIVDFA